MSPSSTNLPLPRVLLIDDDAISREVLSMMLEMHGLPVDSAEDGTQALESVENTETLPSIILMDTQMPGVSGARLIKALRQRLKDRNAGQTRIIAISGSEVGDAIHQAADGFLLKPIQVESVLALIEAPTSSGDAPGLDVQASTASGREEKPETRAILDPAVLGKLKAMMPEAALREVYLAVVTDLETRLATLSAAIDAGDATAVASIAHTIKGGCGMVGLSAATKAAARLENSNLSETWPEELLQLHFALENLQGILSNGLL
jgi:CheY-like chemotaxis protein/HPt (histidine-containing phosphotransfer) domain-containing protein